MELTFFIDPETEQPHIYNHGVTEAEVREVLDRPGLVLNGRGKTREKPVSVLLNSTFPAALAVVGPHCSRTGHHQDSRRENRLDYHGGPVAGGASAACSAAVALE
jgi:hypothetical protein